MARLTLSVASPDPLGDLARERFGRKNGDEAYVFLVKNEEKLGVSVRKQKGSNIKLYSRGFFHFSVEMVLPRAVEIPL